MANKYKITFGAELDISQMKGALNQLQQQLAGLKFPASTTKGVTETFSKLSDEIKNFEELRDKGVKSPVDFAKLEASGEKIISLYEKLKKSTGDLLKLSGKDLEKLFPQSAVDTIEKARKALAAYEGEVKKASTKVDDLNKKIQAQQNLIAQAQAKKTTVESAMPEAQANLDQASKAIQDKTGISDTSAALQKLIEDYNKASEAAKKYEEAVARGESISPAQKGVITKKNNLEALIKTYIDAANKVKVLQDAINSAEGDINKGTDEIGKLNEALKKAQAEQDVGKSNALKGLLDSMKELDGIDMSKYEQSVKGAKQALNDFIDANGAAAKGQIENFLKALELSGVNVDDLKKKLAELSQQVSDTDARMKDIQALKSRIQYFFGLSNTINLVKRAIRGAFNTIKELDKAMTETAVVTDFSVGDMWAQLPEYTKRANELGVTTLAAYQAATLYYQQGLKTNEVNALSVETLKMARIAGLDAAEATDRMTNALRGFNMELTEANAQRVDDVYSELAANTASNVDEISTAMTKVASLAHNANMEFETTAAFLAQIIETTRESAETAGTALKTVVARFSEVKKLVGEGELRGTDEEGQAIDVNKVGAALRTAGIDLNKYFLGEVGLDDIFMELASKWDTLTSVQQRYIATQAAGSRQQSRFIAMMQDYARTQELVGKAYNANGAAARQFEKTQESLESKLNRLKNAWNEFLMGLTNNVVVKKFVDLLTDLLNNINKFTSAVEASTGSLGKWAASWGVAIAVIGGGKALFKDKGLLDGILGMFIGGTGKSGAESLLTKKGISSAFSKFGGIFNKIGAKAGGWLFGSEIAGTAATLTGIATALGAVAAAVGLVVAGYELWLNLTPEGQLKQAQQYAASMDEIAKKAANAASEIKNIQTQYESYTKSIESAGTSEERAQAILSRNEYINKLLQQDSRYAQYIESVINEEGQFVLTFKEGELEKVVKAAEQGVRQAQTNASFAQAVASGKAANVAKQTVQGYLNARDIQVDVNPETERTIFSKRIRDEKGNIVGKQEITGEELEKVSAKYYSLRAETAQKEAEAANTALQAYTELISTLQQTGDIKFDESLGTVGNTIAQSFSEQFNADEYFKLIKEQSLRISHTTKDKDTLQKQYYKEFGTFADPSWDVKRLIEELATNRVNQGQNEAVRQKAQKINDLAANDDIVKALIQALTGQTELVTQTDIDNLLSDKNKKQIQTVADIYGWNPKKLGEQIVQAQEKVRVQRQNASATYYEQLLRAGINPNQNNLAQRIYEEKDLELLQQRADIASVFGNLGSLEQYKDELIQIQELQGADLTQIQNFASSFDLSDPIKAFQQLEAAEKQAGKSSALEGLIQKVREVNKELLSTPSLLRAFGETDEFTELKDSLADVVKENGKITPEKLQELAKTSTSLAAILESAQGKTQGLAEALTLLAQGKISVNQINDALITTLNTGTDFKQLLIDIEGWIKNFNKGTDQKEGIEHFKDSLKELGELSENWEFGNEITENLYNHLFGQDDKNAYKDFIAQFGDDFEAIQKALDAKVQQYTEYSENYGLKAYQAFQAKSDKAIFSGANGEWDLSQYETTAQAINDVAKALEVSEGAAKSFIALWTTRSVELKDAWNNLNADEQLSNLVQNLDNLNFISEDVFKTLAEKWGISFKDAVARFYTEAEKQKKPIEIPIIPSLTDENGNPKTSSQIQDDIQSVYNQGIKKNHLSVIKENPISGATYKTNALDAEAAIAQIQSWGYSLEDAITYVDNSSEQLAKAIQTWDPTENGGQGGFVEKIISADNWDELQTKVKEALKASDYAQQASAIASTVAKPIGDEVGNALSAVFKESYDVKINPDSAGLWQTVQDYLTKNPFTVKMSGFLGGLFGGGENGATGGIVKSRASGSNREISPGWALTGEEGPEIVWNKNGGYAYITGSNGPEFQNLQPGDRIFNAPETRRIFRNTSFAKGGLYPSYANASKSSTIWWKKEEVNKRKGNGGGGSGADSKDAKKQSTWRNELDWLYDLMEDIAEYERQQSILQSKYDLALKDIRKNGRDLFNLTRSELVNLQTQLQAQNTAQLKRLQQMGELQKQVNAAGYGKYVQYNQKDQTLEINWDAIEKIKDKDTYDEVTDWLSRMEDVQGKIDDAESTIWDIKQQIKELQDRYLQKYLDFQSRVMDALVAQYQATIDNLSELNDTLNDNNSNILESIQKEIDLERQIRDNTDTEKQIADLESRIAFLQRDTSNANEVEIRTLQKQLDEARNDYSDTLIDQSIDSLKEANDAAAAQREKQIDLMQAQLDYWQESGALWGEVANLIAGGFTGQGAIVSGSELWDILKSADSWDALSEAQKKNWANELILETNEVGAHLIQLSNGNAVNFEKVRNSIANERGVLTANINAAAQTVRASLASLKGKLGGTPEHSFTATKTEGYASGGTATSTAMALLHGTPQEPEYVLNARQTDAFLRLADILPAALGMTATTGSYSGSAVFNVEVNVGSISDDYGVDSLVARIKEDLYDAASYRNSNVLGFLR